MPRVSKHMEATSTPDRVFALVTDLDRRPDWQHHLSQVDRLSDGPVGVGSRFRDVGKFGKSTLEVTAFDPPRHFAYRSVDGPFDATIDMEIRGKDGGTELDTTVTLEPRGLGKLLWLLVGHKATAQMHADVAALEETVQRL